MTTGTPVSGIIATKEDVEAFRESCVFLRSQWLHYTTLFEGSDLKREMLETTAPIFFGDLNQLLKEHLVLQICRLTDESQTRDRKNLTVKFLMEHTDWSTAPGTLAALKAISDSIQNFRKLILPARKWFIAHHDLSAVRLGQSLGAASDAEWKQFWLDLQDFLEMMCLHHVDPNLHFYLNAAALRSDAESLLTALMNAKRFEAVIEDREISSAALRAAQTSRFAGDL
jgi:hypothetical protein